MTVRRTRGTRRTRHGMTLLEVIVALTVAGSALASGAAVLGFLTDQQARTGTRAVASASAMRHTLRAWTSQARLTTEGDAEFRGRPGGAMPSQRAASDEISFVTTAPTAVSESGTMVRLYVATDARGDANVASPDPLASQGLVAELRPWRHAGPSTTIPLAPDAIGLRVRYLSSMFGQRSWLDSWVSTSVLPAAVELRIRYDSTAAPDDARAARALLATPMLVPLAGRQ